MLVSIAGGKGGVGKSVVACNLAMGLARRRLRVVLADMDVGGANLHVMLGQYAPERTLADFLQRRVTHLEDLLLPVSFCPGLQLLPGGSNTLDAVNPHHATRRRVLRELARLDVDVVLVDVGAGASYTTLDIFLGAERQIAVTTPDPAAVLEVYTFIKLAAARVLQADFGSKDAVGAELRRHDFAGVDYLLRFAASDDEARAARAQQALERFHPMLVVNRVTATTRLNVGQLKRILHHYVGSELSVLAEIPDDEAVARSVRRYLPVVDDEPDSPAAQELRRAAEQLAAEVQRPTAPAPPLEMRV